MFHCICVYIYVHACSVASVLSVCLQPYGRKPIAIFYEILQARILEWVAVSSSRGSSRPEVQSVSFITPELAGKFLITHATWEVPVCVFIYIYKYIYYSYSFPVFLFFLSYCLPVLLF